MQDIDIAHRVPAKSAQSNRPNPIICKFVRPLAKEKVMSARRATSNVVAADLDLTPGSITHIGIYDHLTPRLQNLLYEANRFKTANNYKYCWAKIPPFIYAKMIRQELLSLAGSTISPLCQTMRPYQPKDLMHKMWKSDLLVTWILFSI